MNDKFLVVLVFLALIVIVGMLVQQAREDEIRQKQHEED